MQEADALRAFKKRLCKPVLININKYLTMESSPAGFLLKPHYPPVMLENRRPQVRACVYMRELKVLSPGS